MTTTWLDLERAGATALTDPAGVRRVRIAEAQRPVLLAAVDERVALVRERGRLAPGPTKRWGQCECCGDARRANQGGTCELCAAALRRILAEDRAKGTTT